MDPSADSIARLYADWQRYNDRIVGGLRDRSPEELGLRAAPDYWPIWAIAGHTASARVYWLCSVFGEPGAVTTPFTDPTGFGWEDDLDTPRTADELVWAFESSWRIIQGCLERWTPAMLDEAVRRQTQRGVQLHTRQSVLMRLITHDAYHAGEIALTLGIHGREVIDMWPASPIAAEP